MWRLSTLKGSIVFRSAVSLTVLLIACPLVPSGAFAADAHRTPVRPAQSLNPSRPEPVPAPAPQPAARPDMSLADLEGLALANNPTLRQAAANVEAARGRWVQVGLYPNPMGGYMAGEMGSESTAGQQGGFISQDVITGGKLRLNRAIACQEIRRLEAEFAAQRGRVLNDVRIQFYEVLVAQRGIELAGELMRIAEQGRHAANKLLEAKEVSRVDVLQADVEFEIAQIQQVNARNRQLSAWRRLAAVVGVPRMNPVVVRGNLDRLLPQVAWEDAMMRLIARSPEIASAQARIGRARFARDRAVAQPLPNFNIQASVQHDNSTSDDIAGVQIGIPIPVLNRNQGGIRQADAEIVASRANASRVELLLQTRLAQAFEVYSNARSQVEAYSTKILPSARRTVDLVNSAYRQGEINFVTSLTAQRTYFQTNIAYLNALMDLRRSEIMIEGMLLSDSLSASSLEVPESMIPGP